ncbi:hypothetical protein BDV95DRAFT_606032 [Massariosphaeria phaeospora]|uniref:BTB domain-containing protein n=1 Tax=Massariosphaeria phaeospora TaxID=100035 RepID=A0A7C8M9H0_9PLEO|nr:hypothetical protein BDV95DRAFT_606032 [Massariosphaeria phaeospora]
MTSTAIERIDLTSPPSSPPPSPSPSVAARSGAVVVQVGQERRAYVLHKATIIHHSGWFADHLRENPDERIITPPKMGSAGFNLFVDWIYGHKNLNAIDNDIGHGQAPLIYRAYVLADKLVVPKMKRAAFDIIFPKLQYVYPPYRVVIYAFKNLPENDPLLTLLVDSQTVNGGTTRVLDGDDKKFVRELPQQFLTEIMLRLSALGQVKKEEAVELQRANYDAPVPWKKRKLIELD